MIIFHDEFEFFGRHILAGFMVIMNPDGRIHGNNKRNCILPKKKTNKQT